MHKQQSTLEQHDILFFTSPPLYIALQYHCRTSELIISGITICSLIFVSIQDNVISLCYLFQHHAEVFHGRDQPLQPKRGCRHGVAGSGGPRLPMLRHDSPQFSLVLHVSCILVCAKLSKLNEKLTLTVHFLFPNSAGSI